MNVITNHVPRDIVYDYELSELERKDFDYHNWDAIERGEDSASFIRYRGEIYDLGEFSTTRRLPEFSELCKWDGYINDSYFSGIVVRYVENFERVVVGRFFA